MIYPAFFLRAYRKAEVAKRMSTRKKLRLSRYLGTLKSNFGLFDKVYIKITYAKGEFNEGYYTNFHDLYNAWLSFLEVLKDYETR